MKYVVLLGDGMADEPLAELNGQTPLQAADTPNMDRLARQGSLGMVQTIPAEYPPGSDVANLSAFGYDPRICYSGRSPLEAASMGVELGPDDIAFRLNLVTLGDRNGEVYMDDFSAGHIGSEQAGQLVEALQQEFGGENFSFHPGVSYRHLMIWHGGREQMSFTPPHDITGQAVADFLPKGEGAEILKDLATRANALLESHEVNRDRIAAGNKPANAIWLWGHGRAPQMETLRQKFGISGAVISAVDLIKGIGVYAGLDVIEVPGATGYLDTDYLAKARYALESLKTRDYVYVHVEAPDEASHSGDLPEKIRAIESFDQLVVGTLLEGLPALGEFRLMVLPDHPTPVKIMTHTGDAVPFVLYDSRGLDKPNAFAGSAYHEKAAVDTGFFIEHGYELMNHLITGCS